MKAEPDKRGWADIGRAAEQSASAIQIDQDAMRDRLADSMRPGHVWIAGIRFPAPSPGSMMALCLFRSPFIDSEKRGLLESELPLHVITALYCLALGRDAIPAAHAEDAQAVAEWAETLEPFNYIDAAGDIVLITSSIIHGFRLFGDDEKKKTVPHPPKPRTGARSSYWLKRLFRRASVER